MSKVLDIGPYGLLHSVTVPHTGNHFEALHQLVADTPCTANFLNISNALHDHEIRILRQNCGGNADIYATKLPNGLVFHDANGIFHSMLHAKSMYLPDNHPQENIPDYEIIAHVKPLGRNHIKPINVVMHDDVGHPAQITRDMPYEHIQKQLYSLSNLTSEPRELYSADTMGNFSGRIIQGKDAALIKSAFMGLVDHFRENEGIYDRNIVLVPQITEKLMVKNPEGNVHLFRGVDCIVGGRRRNVDNGITFLFVAKSDDFHDKEMSDPETTKMQILKMDYFNKDTTGCKKRISFVMHPDDVNSLSKEYQEQTVLNGQMTLQEMLNCISHCFKGLKLEELNCGSFMQYNRLMEFHQ